MLSKVLSTFKKPIKFLRPNRVDLNTPELSELQEIYIEDEVVECRSAEPGQASSSADCQAADERLAFLVACGKSLDGLADAAPSYAMLVRKLVRGAEVGVVKRAVKAGLTDSLLEEEAEKTSWEVSCLESLERSCSRPDALEGAVLKKQSGVSLDLLAMEDAISVAEMRTLARGINTKS